MKLFSKVILIFIYSQYAIADYSLYNGIHGTVDIGMDIKVASFVETNNWFGKAQEKIGVKGDLWLESTFEPYIRAQWFLPGGGSIYGHYSTIYSQTIGNDVSGKTKGLNNPGLVLTEQAYIGWRSQPLSANYDNAFFDISIGQQDYKIGSGFIMYKGSNSGGRRGAWWIGGRHAFKNSVIGKINTKNFSIHGFHLESRPRNGGDGNVFNGMNLEISLSKANEIGFMYINLDRAVSATADGLNAYSIRATLSPFTQIPELSFNGEYVYETNGSALKSQAGYGRINYHWSDVGWQPRLSYRYAYYQGDDPDTSIDEGFNPLAFGSSDWGSWWQGEITGEHVLAGRNLITHMVQLHFTPHQRLILDLFYYNYHFDQPRSVNLTNSHYGDEVNLISTWKTTANATIITTLSATIPGEGGKQFSDGGNQVWFQFMLYGKYNF